MHLLRQAADPLNAGEIAGMLPNGIQQTAFTGVPSVILVRGEIIGVLGGGDHEAIVFPVGDEQLPLSRFFPGGGADLLRGRPDHILQPGGIAGESLLPSDRHGGL